ncbi:L-threonylcarbamoyladenylate synthase [Chitinophaga barathri]|uniref:L-threonylcarbamoyladenylate synthase n=1 Tax=Chitinophaga barathri TaxID=1647451 RepID=A0A3N4M8P4_9BACT|nr:L-threonylcarbamoyladenylate synthase [Chitinophaga barathri]RPD39831.1 threonylcarbamoyl-AMP synthase [Chitinophaga barathri]
MTEFENDITKSLAVLRQSGIILYPTDTIWGLGCDATDEEAVKRIYALKQRSEAKSLVILMADTRDLVRYLAHPPPDIELTLKSFDRPTTVIYEGALHLAPSVINQDGSIAIRIVQDTFCRHLIKRLRKPLVSTSANLSGAPSPAVFGDVEDAIRHGVDYTVKYRQQDHTPARPSRIVRIGKDGALEIIRN